MKKISLLAASLLLIASANATTPTTPTYNDVFISYFSTDNVKSMMNYINTHKDATGNVAPLKGFIVWEFRGDMPYGTPSSLLSAANSAINPSNPPMIMGYWSDWTVYSPSRMFGEPPYGVPGSINGATGTTVTNADFSAKLEGMNAITYAFLEAQPNNPSTANAKTGTLFFFDPWSDLQSNDYSFCQSNPDICNYAMKNPPSDQKSFDANVKMGNFGAFGALQNSSKTLKKIFSVGGYGHDITFEDTMTNPQYITNFVNSANAILKQYNYDGIDLDYENPSMTPAQSLQFQDLVDTLAKTLTPEGKQIYVTILANPARMSVPATAAVGFETGVLSHIANEVTGINLMTYDFHGAFDYNPNGSGKTGFLSNIQPVDNEANSFSVINAVNAATGAGIPANKLSVGVPAYGRALQGISKGKDSTGLNEAITNTAIPRGDLDTPDCNTDIANLGADSCSGSFEYQFIQNQMLGSHGFTQTDWPAQGGTTAYADKWSYQPSTPNSYNLTLNNNGAIGIIVSIKGNDSKFGPSDYIGPNNSKTYTATTYVSTSDINGKSNLIVNWSTYSGGPAGSCTQALNLTNNMSVSIAIDNQGKATCNITQS